MDGYASSAETARINAVAKEIKKFYKDHKEVTIPIREMRDRIRLMVYKHGDSVLEDNGEVFTISTRAEHDDLRDLLIGPRRRKLAKEMEESLQPELFIEQEDRFNGYVKFSPDKLEAMVVHLAYRGKRVNQTRLNKLLFYVDFNHFALHGRALTGTEYTKLTHGPIYSAYRELIKWLEKRRLIRTTTYKVNGKYAKVLRAMKSYRPSKSILSAGELNLIDWVVDTYDHLPTRASSVSHIERWRIGILNGNSP